MMMLTQSSTPLSFRPSNRIFMVPSTRDKAAFTWINVTSNQIQSQTFWYMYMYVNHAKGGGSHLAHENFFFFWGGGGAVVNVQSYVYTPALADQGRHNNTWYSYTQDIKIITCNQCVPDRRKVLPGVQSDQVHQNKPLWTGACVCNRRWYCSSSLILVLKGGMGIGNVPCGIGLV
jgi:hypothetical protein